MNFFLRGMFFFVTSRISDAYLGKRGLRITSNDYFNWLFQRKRRIARNPTGNPISNVLAHTDFEAIAW